MLRKWEYIAEALKNLGAPNKIISAAQEIDNILVSLGLGYNTSYWIDYISGNEYQNEGWKSLCGIVYDATYCSACLDINDRDIKCSLCLLSKGMGRDTSCTPRSVYADDYYVIVSDYVNNKL